MKLYFGTVFSILAIHYSYAQNNAIFYGGEGKGESLFCYSQANAVLNNSIFLGGESEGSNVFCYQQSNPVLNNNIFIGGNSIGERVFCYEQDNATINNSIFKGGNASGSRVSCYEQLNAILNNNIFIGGNSIGEHVFCYEQLSPVLNNSIFIGGNSIGEIVFCYEQDNAIINNNIFKGGTSAGFARSCVGTLEAVPLPIQVLIFELIELFPKVHLYWRVSSVINTEYIVEKSSNGIEWNEIGTLKGNSFSYHFTDSLSHEGTFYYRFKYRDEKSALVYSPIRNVYYSVANTSEHHALIYPNPTNSEFFVVTSSSHYEIELINSLGQIVYKIENATSVNVNEYPNGIYTVKITFRDGVSLYRKILIQK
ncbi:MAG: T9SS type A sorting domain-containing protein [Cytophagales bacterium]|nr:T9SS type A sorting domain-containing protein [Cytophagales bacterium]MDW8383640.1 T9SS type A sorting domain-containing protein [Flammeovirgaceae bacterium]